MATDDVFLTTVQAIHAAGLDEGLWPAAIRALCNALGAPSGDLEISDKRTMRLTAFHAHGVPPFAEIAYAAEYMKQNPRLPNAFRQRPGDIGYDRQHIDEAGMKANAFYSEFLPGHGIRYYVSAILANDAHTFAGICINRTAKAGHAQQADIALMGRFLPHLQQAYGTNLRLGGTSRGNHVLEDLLDRLVDGLVVIAADGSVRFANTAARLIAARRDGIHLSTGGIGFSLAEARKAYEVALQGIRRLIAGGTDPPQGDFLVRRPDGISGYLVSVRPLMPAEDDRWSAFEAFALVLIRDPASAPSGGIASVARVLFGLTHAEASLADALRSGISLPDYARARRLSLNTVYTHLRRIKAKTGCRTMQELIARLAALTSAWRD